MARIYLIAVAVLFCSMHAFAQAGVYRTWEDAMQEKENVYSIHMTYRSMEEIPDILDEFPNLEELNLSNNRIKSLPPSLFSCKKLKKLILFRNKLTVIPDGIGKLTNLE